jgi:hypothetical protein
MFYNWPKDLDTQSATYKSEGVHKNRDSTAKMQVEAKNRDGQTDAELAAERTAAAMEKNIDSMPKGIGVDEPMKIAKGEKDVTQEQQKMVNKASAANISSVEPGHIAWYPTPMQGTQASYGDGAPKGSNAQKINQDEAMSGLMSAGAEGYMSGGMSGAGSAMGGAGMGMISSSIGQDIASKDDSVDQATEALFQDDSVGEAHRALGEKLQGR